jgi:3-phenylpropionate/cinnamic acid dioxygenase small subunit
MTIPNPIDPHLQAEVVAAVTRYASGLDNRDWGLFRSAFTDDAVIDYGPLMGSFTSSADFAAYMREAHAPAGLSVHRMTNVVVTQDGGVITARTYGDALLQYREDSTTYDHSAGYYDDVLVRTPDGLRIAKRTATTVLYEHGTGNLAAGADLPV